MLKCKFCTLKLTRTRYSLHHNGSIPVNSLKKMQRGLDFDENITYILCFNL